MDFLNQIGKQLTELFQSMTPAARVTAGLLLAVVVVSIGYLFRASTAGPDEFLFGGEPLTASQITAMTAAMSQAGLNDFEVHGAHIKAPRNKRHEYIAAVADAGVLPASASDYMDKAINASGPFETREQKLQRTKLGREQQFSHIIGLMPWVEQAAVIYDVKSTRGPRPKEVASATVSIQPKPGEALTSQRQRRVRDLVAGGFTSMSPDDVIVNDLGGGESFAGDGGDADPFVFESPYHRERVRVENEKRREILSQLSFIPGVRVQVSAVLDQVMQRQSAETRPETVQAVSEITGDETITEVVVDNANRPGTTINGPRGVASNDPPRRENRKEIKNVTGETVNKVGEVTSQEVTAGLAATEINASIQIPQKFVVEYWRNQQQLLGAEVPETIDQQALDTAEADVITNVEELVKQLLPKQAAQSEYKQVKVVVMGATNPEPLPEPSLASTTLGWLSNNSNTLAMVGVALFSLVMLRSVVRSSPVGDGDGSPLLRLGDEGELAAKTAGGYEDDEDEDGRPKLKLRKQESLTDDLSEIVREDPDAAAAILRGWIDNAG